VGVLAQDHVGLQAQLLKPETPNRQEIISVNNSKALKTKQLS
jgi:hypothetical protein